MGKRLATGVRKFIREEKGRIRASVTDKKEAERLVTELVARYAATK